MPTGVVDAFKNLIRHGKHHNHNVTNQHPKQVDSSPPPSMTPVPSHPVVSPGPREAAQIIVDEERQAHSKMPRYQGLDNFELIDKMGDENLSRHVILQVAQGIRYLHEERGVVHRDIKPENLLFERIPIIPTEHPTERRPYDEEKEDEGQFIPGVGGGGIGRVKIADFGLSKVVWNEETMTPCGTVGYTAPEIVKDERYSKSVDMWALGCVLYTLLCGFPPFYDESINVLTEKVARGYYTFLSPWWDDISHSGMYSDLSFLDSQRDRFTAKDLITHLLCVDPAQRYSIDEFLNHPWCTASPAPPPPPTPAVYTNQPNSAMSNVSSIPLDSPLLSAARGGRAHEGKSPGVTTLKEAFDITYAVHRMEEEGARRRKYKGVNAGARVHLDALNEDEDDDYSEEVDSSNGGVGAGDRWRTSRSQHESTRQQAASGHAATGNSKRAYKGGFQLDLEGATLLGRRNRKAGVGVAPAVSSPLSGKTAGSPIRLEDLRMDDSSSFGNGIRAG
ncbi:hypothetical protein C0993_012125 [Termitomyces sp. T159_Od127]|nr:hypothetical protein C0993_012125 [Termitomyces sp. T159_Od127]